MKELANFQGRNKSQEREESQKKDEILLAQDHREVFLLGLFIIKNRIFYDKTPRIKF